MNRHKYIPFKLKIPIEYYCKVNDILNEFMVRFNMVEGDIVKLQNIIDIKNKEFIENLPNSLDDNFFIDIIEKRKNGLRSVKILIDDELRLNSIEGGLNHADMRSKITNNLKSQT